MAYALEQLAEWATPLLQRMEPAGRKAAMLEVAIIDAQESGPAHR
jgi:hypothetical protein